MNSTLALLLSKKKDYLEYQQKCEDTSVSLETIYNLFGKVVGEAVDAITKREGEDRPTYLARCASNKIARVVKLHDAMFNATSCHKNKTKFNYYLQTIAALEQK